MLYSIYLLNYHWSEHFQPFAIGEVVLLIVLTVIHPVPNQVQHLQFTFCTKISSVVDPYHFDPDLRIRIHLSGNGLCKILNLLLIYKKQILKVMKKSLQ